AEWSAAHRSDTARLIRLGLEKAPAGTRLHACAEESVTTRTIAEAIGRTLGLPVESIAAEDAGKHFGFVGDFFAMSMAASSALTREGLSWEPTGPTLVEDIESGAYVTA
ncbi:MAG TPA: 3-beta hydroxysteroid dehydrogenase, partial [Umezawaea sp.]|nr:3-beta hydroxysteroid dehydrogenase [Umezawaea sp.]